ncbi:MAG TPA: 23S rRNA (pseudouridine(1915)-N(3))-methyltransferase RlmH [Desulfobulbaceae bacterium]|nr:23S rRNA (pseudouridine(1915)-N(3))-methyltransferase RlmH [Desulfobulbaceae bacterium]
MKFIFLFLGKTRRKYLETAISDYAARLGHFVEVDIIVLRERYSRNASDSEIKKAGSNLLLNRSGRKSFKVALDVSGRQFDSPKLAQVLQGWRDRGLQDVYFLIGGHLGLDHNAVQAADVVWSLSKLTFTHEMARMIVLEQLYRACTITAGLKYHK